MKNFSTKPNRENAIKMFKTDGARRNGHIFNFVNLINSISSNCVIALDGEWGSGKTFFAMQTKLILDASNGATEMADDDREAIQAVIVNKNIKCDNGIATVYYDAWANDNSQDPILSFFYEALKDIPTADDKRPKLKEILKSIAKIAIKGATGVDVKDFLSALESESIFNQVKEEENTKALMKSFFDEILQERANRLVVFIDELDRCKPEYAVKLLERIKHYFDDERAVFVLSVNLSQLQHTIKAYYGSGFDATRYFEKFFDLTVTVPQLEYNAYIVNCFPKFAVSSESFKRTCREAINYFKFNLREIERYLRICKMLDSIDVTQDRHRLELVARRFFVPIAVGLSLRDGDKYRKFLKGEAFEVVLDIFPENEYNARWVNNLETHMYGSGSVEKDATTYDQKLIAIYEAVFLDAKIPSYGDTPGLVKQSVNSLLSLLSHETKLDFE